MVPEGIEPFFCQRVWPKQPFIIQTALRLWSKNMGLAGQKPVPWSIVTLSPIHEFKMSTKPPQHRNSCLPPPQKKKDALALSYGIFLGGLDEMSWGDKITSPVSPAVLGSLHPLAVFCPKEVIRKEVHHLHQRFPGERFVEFLVMGSYHLIVE